MKLDYLQIRVLEVAPQVYASGSLYESDLKLVAEQGVRTIVNTRPDNESPGQPTSAELEKAAEDLGMDYLHFPFGPGSIDKDAAAAFAAACENLKRPMMVCSNSGGRATRIWETAELA